MSQAHYESLRPAFPINGVVLVGVCASGKTTASQGLANYGIVSRAVAQEHSMVAGLYRKGGLGLVVLLVASWATVHRRRHLAWEPEFYRTEWMRLQGARKDAHLILHTDELNRKEVVDTIVRWWDQRLGLETLWLRYPHWRQAEQAHIRRAVASGVPLADAVKSLLGGPSIAATVL
ncbi:MAG: hypothetical protein ACYCOU_05840 [Sulfobacillus sp.]